MAGELTPGATGLSERASKILDTNIEAAAASIARHRMQRYTADANARRAHAAVATSSWGSATVGTVQPMLVGRNGERVYVDLAPMASADEGGTSSASGDSAEAFGAWDGTSSEDTIPGEMPPGSHRGTPGGSSESDIDALLDTIDRRTAEADDDEDIASDADYSVTEGQWEDNDDGADNDSEEDAGIADAKAVALPSRSAAYSLPTDRDRSPRINTTAVRVPEVFHSDCDDSDDSDNNDGEEAADKTADPAAGKFLPIWQGYKKEMMLATGQDEEEFEEPTAVEGTLSPAAGSPRKGVNQWPRKVPTIFHSDYEDSDEEEQTGEGKGGDDDEEGDEEDSFIRDLEAADEAAELPEEDQDGQQEQQDEDGEARREEEATYKLYMDALLRGEDGQDILLGHLRKQERKAGEFAARDEAAQDLANMQMPLAAALGSGGSEAKYEWGPVSAARPPSGR